MNCLIVCNGVLSKKLLNKFQSLKLQDLNRPRKKLIIISCDGASDFLYKCKITPDYIIGDLDSINSKTLSYFKSKKVTVKKIQNQNLTDFEKALRFAISKKLKKIFVTGFSGKRLDHTIANLSLLKQYSKKARIKVYDDTFEAFYVNKKAEFGYRKSATVSLLALPKAAGIKTDALKWKLNRETLAFGGREGVSNEATRDHVKIEASGDLIVVKKHFGKIEI